MANSWIFQGNPNTYRVRDAIARLTTINWSVKAHASEMNVGDTVYLWESGALGGLVGQTTIVAGVADRQEPPEEGEFWVTPTEQTTKSCVQLRIDRVFEPDVKRADLLGEPKLATLKLLKMP